MSYVSFDDFKKMDIRVGTIREIEPVEGTDKLLKCQVDFGFKPTEEGLEPERDIRQIVSGIRDYYPEYEKLIGKQVLYIVNLEPRTIRGVESHGMLMAVDGIDEAPVFLVPEKDVKSGSKIR